MTVEHFPHITEGAVDVISPTFSSHWFGYNVIEEVW